jgi:hypothetical protein
MLDNVFPIKRPAAAGPFQPRDTAPGYDPDLTTFLTAEHRSLLSLLLEARDAAKRARYEEIKPILQQFGVSLTAHNVRESTRFLPYLERHLKAEGSRALLQSLCGNAALTERSVAGFLQHYLQYTVTDRNVMRFGRELDEVLGELRRRLACEETSLFCLYHPADEY